MSIWLTPSKWTSSRCKSKVDCHCGDLSPANVRPCQSSPAQWEGRLSIAPVPPNSLPCSCWPQKISEGDSTKGKNSKNSSDAQRGWLFAVFAAFRLFPHGTSISTHFAFSPHDTQFEPNSRRRHSINLNWPFSTSNRHPPSQLALIDTLSPPRPPFLYIHNGIPTEAGQHALGRPLHRRS